MKQTVLRDLANDLRDAQRYVADWNRASVETTKLKQRLIKLAIAYLETNLEKGALLATDCERLGDNIEAGLNLVVTSPQVLRNYLACAAVELESMAERLEKEQANV
jgi:hypothetical protein